MTEHTLLMLALGAVFGELLIVARITKRNVELLDKLSRAETALRIMRRQREPLSLVPVSER